ncbi:hypothetical protein LCGC14_2537880 [marine sediment metagenome]|uniref:Uncharacterized protein n=1 Tax=marine sediment metagenome TaxID=412755 RepID=A0A0F9D388_9ZZZZ
MPNERLKEHGRSTLHSIIVSWIPLVGAFWFLAKPILITAVSEAVADDIKIQVESSIRPINSAFKVLLGQQILNLKKDIAATEYKRDHESEDWLNEDSQQLVSMESELKALEEAKEEL